MSEKYTIERVSGYSVWLNNVCVMSRVVGRRDGPESDERLISPACEGSVVSPTSVKFKGV
jgi:hypothetical protein